MTMDNTETTTPDEPLFEEPIVKEKRKYRRRKHKPAPRIAIVPKSERTPPPIKTPDHPPPLDAGHPQEFAGLNNTACCDECFVARCVITGKPYCGHPNKGGLHASSMQDRVVINRFARAKEYLRNNR